MRTAPQQQPQPPDLVRLIEEAGPARKRRKKLLVTGAIVAALAVLAFVMLRGGGEKGPRFETAEVSRADLQVTISATGNLRGLNTVEVGAEVSGKIIEVLVDHNTRVEKGQLLARIDPEQFQAAMEEASARVAAAEAAVRQAQTSREEADSKLRRGEAQDKEGLIARQDLETLRATAQRAVAGVASARADAQLARANLTSARSKLDKTEIRAPIGGVILSRLVEPGQTVTAGFQTPVLFKVAEDLTRMELTAKVDESDVGKVREGQRATFTVDAWPDSTFEAKVLTVRNEPVTDQTVVSYETILSVDNAEGKLRPGMTATATIVVDERKNALVVPNAALRFSPPASAQPRRGLPLPGMGRPRGPRTAAAAPAGPRIWIEEPGVGPKPIPVKVVASDGQRSEVEAQELAPGMHVLVDVAEAP